MADSQRFSTTTTITANPAGATEAVIATLAGVQTLYDGQSVKLSAHAQFAPAASTTSAIFKIRRDSVTGTTVATSPTYNGGSITTPKVDTYDVYGIDTPTGNANATYVLTVTLAAAGGATTIGGVMLEARVD